MPSTVLPVRQVVRLRWALAGLSAAIPTRTPVMLKIARAILVVEESLKPAAAVETDLKAQRPKTPSEDAPQNEREQYLLDAEAVDQQLEALQASTVELTLPEALTEHELHHFKNPLNPEHVAGLGPMFAG